jgi:hypothetical protein
MRRHAVALCVAAVALTGCVAGVREIREYGASRPAPGADVAVTEERASTPEGTACRTVVTTTRAVREVDVRRSFVDPRRQELNLALVVLAGIGSSFVAYDAATVACNGNGGCTGLLSSATWPIAAVTASLAAVPLAFAAYNARRVQDETRVEPAPPIVDPGPWRPCAVPHD